MFASVSYHLEDVANSPHAVSHIIASGGAGGGVALNCISCAIAHAKHAHFFLLCSSDSKLAVKTFSCV